MFHVVVTSQAQARQVRSGVRHDLNSMSLQQVLKNIALVEVVGMTQCQPSALLKRLFNAQRTSCRRAYRIMKSNQLIKLVIKARWRAWDIVGIAVKCVSQATRF